MVKKLLLLPCCLLLVACTSAYTNEYSHSTLWLRQAGEARALQYQAFNLAKLRLDIALKHYKGKKPLAVVVDIDETVLDNNQSYAREILANRSYTSASWTAWVKEQRAIPIPGARDFLQYADKRGVAVFYLSNRKQQQEQEPTYENLRAFGFPIERSRLLFRTDTSSKKTRRNIVDQTHHIVLLMGDNLSDFSSVFDKQSVTVRNHAVDQNRNRFGNDFIVLPNSIYGDWETAFYDHKNSLSESEKYKIRRQYLEAMARAKE
jgi:5'-nucleotidase (lipoprotein e(P4) family)